MEGMLGGIVGLVGAGLQAQAQAAQVQYEYAALNWQKQRAREQDRFSQASRVDAFGNRTGYDPGLNEWSVTLSPDQKTMQQAQTREQLLQLTKDAPEARALRNKLRQRAHDAEEPFRQAALGYQYDKPPPWEALKGQISTMMAQNEQGRSKADQAGFVRSALRMGRGNAVPDIINAVQDDLGQAAPDRELAARQEAFKESGQLQAMHEQKWGTPMKIWGEIMQQGGQLPSAGGGGAGSPIGKDLDNSIQQQQAMMASGFQAGTQGVGAAMQNVANALGKSPDLGSAASAFSKVGGGGNSRSTARNKQKTQQQADSLFYDPTQDYAWGGDNWGMISSDDSYF